MPDDPASILTLATIAGLLLGFVALGVSHARSNKEYIDNYNRRKATGNLAVGDTYGSETQSRDIIKYERSINGRGKVAVKYTQYILVDRRTGRIRKKWLDYNTGVQATPQEEQFMEVEE